MSYFGYAGHSGIFGGGLSASLEELLLLVRLATFQVVVNTGGGTITDEEYVEFSSCNKAKLWIIRIWALTAPTRSSAPTNRYRMVLLSACPRSIRPLGWRFVYFLLTSWPLL